MFLNFISEKNKQFFSVQIQDLRAVLLPVLRFSQLRTFRL